VQVVTNAPIYVTEDVRSRLFKWALPFTRDLWVTIACSIIASAIVMVIFEHNTEGACCMRDMLRCTRRQGTAWMTALMPRACRRRLPTAR
jgi:hypothetical protein